MLAHAISRTKSAAACHSDSDRVGPDVAHPRRDGVDRDAASRGSRAGSRAAAAPRSPPSPPARRRGSVAAPSRPTDGQRACWCGCGGVFGSNASGAQISAPIGKSKPGGITPTTSDGAPSTSTACPTIDGSCAEAPPPQPVAEQDLPVAAEVLLVGEERRGRAPAGRPAPRRTAARPGTRSRAPAHRGPSGWLPTTRTPPDPGSTSRRDRAASRGSWPA